MSKFEMLTPQNSAIALIDHQPDLMESELRKAAGNGRS
jgi:hypothetical protein